MSRVTGMLLMVGLLVGCVGQAEYEVVEDEVIDARVPLAVKSVAPGSVRTAQVKQAPLPNEEEVEDQVEPDIHFPIESWDRGGYPGDGPYCTISYEDEEDESTYITASRIAYMALLLGDVWEEWGLPNPEAVRERLSRFHIIAVHAEQDTPSPTMARLKYPDMTEDEALEEMGNLGAFCWASGNARLADIPEGTKFVIVIKAWFLNEGFMETVLHEMVHPAMLVGYGDSDGDHLREDIWLRHGDDTLMGAVMERSPFEIH